MPQMALKSCMPAGAPATADVPQIAEFRAGKNVEPPNYGGAHRRCQAKPQQLFMVDWTIGFISDDIRFFMRFAFLLHRCR